MTTHAAMMPVDTDGRLLSDARDAARQLLAAEPGAEAVQIRLPVLRPAGHAPLIVALSRQGLAVPSDAGRPAAASEPVAGLWLWHDAAAQLTVGLPEAATGGADVRLRFADPAEAPPASTLTRWRAVLRMTAGMLDALVEQAQARADLAALSGQADRLRRQVRTDALTGLAGKPAFEEAADRRLADPARPAMLILAEIERLRAVTDLYGAQFADAFVRAVAEELVETLPTGSLIGRLCGSEFAALVDLPAGQSPTPAALRLRCTRALSRATRKMGRAGLGTVVLGTARFPGQGGDLDRLLATADAELGQGRAAQSANPAAPAQRRLNGRGIGRQFASAVTQGRIVPFFQPIVDLHNGTCRGHEVLARWLDPARGVLGPRAFRAVFSDYRHAEQLTFCIARQVMQTLSAAPQGETVMSLNLTSFDLMNPGFVLDFQTLLAEFGLRWQSFVFEVTESVMLDAGGTQVFRTLDTLRARGAGIALDDFGTGYGGLRHLSGWPVDRIKIDRHFTAAMDRDRTDFAVTQAIAAIAREAGYSLVAEGIETEAQVRALRGIGCDLGQGFLFSRPVAREALAHLPQVFAVPDQPDASGS
ncbi:GGDEF domain-containing phosphodiesterase [Pseudoponticoccus marisrubri]|nr:GGDEF domain-containing phosphodiesterase [Pseudoponticoccus marisrubri]